MGQKRTKNLHYMTEDHKNLHFLALAFALLLQYSSFKFGALLLKGPKAMNTGKN